MRCSAAALHELVVTHGNGPQVGLLALEGAAYQEVTPYPLDVLGAESPGMIGYVLTQALANATARPTAAVVIQVVVDADDAARDWGTAAASPIEQATPSELERLTFAAGSMGPKVTAACRFVAVVAGRAGTRIEPTARLAMR